jgi:hypothetical protein
MAETTFVQITKNTPHGWSAFSEAELDVVPDPMVLRTGEIFLLGRSDAQRIHLDPETHRSLAAASSL